MNSYQEWDTNTRILRFTAVTRAEIGEQGSTIRGSTIADQRHAGLVRMETNVVEGRRDM